jgi:hypothetical protein
MIDRDGAPNEFRGNRPAVHCRVDREATARRGRLFSSEAFGPTRATRSRRRLPPMSAIPRTPRAGRVAALVEAASDMAAAVEVFTDETICDVGWE